MVATMMLATRVRREQRVLSLINSGGLEFLKMLTEMFGTTSDASCMGEGKRRLIWFL